MLVLSVPLPITGARAELRQGILLEKSPREEEYMGGDYSGKKKEREGRQKEGGKEKER